MSNLVTIIYLETAPNIVKKFSCVSMSVEELEKVLAAMREKGFTIEKQNFKNRQDKLFRNDQYCKAYSLWQELHQKGKVKNKSPLALNNYLKRLCPDFKKNFSINTNEFILVIETLKKWLGRTSKDELHNIKRFNSE